MIIRKIKPEEKLAADMISTIAFVGSEDYTERMKNPYIDTAGYEYIWGHFTDNNILTSCVAFYPLDVMFDGHRVRMSGVGNVAALPEHRASGSVKSIMIAALREMLDTDVIFSYLYPFSHQYYRKFGYELCFTRHTVTIQTDALKGRDQKGSLDFYQPNTDLEPYIDIYRRFIAGYNLAVARNKEDFKKLINKDPYKDRQYTYLWKDEEGSPGAYIIFQAGERNEDFSHIMKIIEFAWVSIAGFNGMLGMLPRFQSQYHEISWEIPENICPYTLVGEPYEVSVSESCGGMNRIVNVPTALSLMRPPEGAGEVIISVTDPILRENDGAYKISWDNGRLSAASTSRASDAAVDIQTLTRLVCGYATPDTLEITGNIDILKNRENLNRLFHKKDLYITDRF